MARRRASTKGPGFDFSLHMRRLCEDIVTRSPELSHIDLSRVAIAYARSRKPVAYGLQAALTPLRFEAGSRYTTRRGRRWSVQKVVDREGREMLYILSFYLPRFLDTPYKEKLTTIFHELWHVSPSFDGDVRRHEGRCYAHTSSQNEYDRAMWDMAKSWLSLDPPEPLHAFLHYNFKELTRRWGHVHGTRIAAPKLYPVVEPGTADFPQPHTRAAAEMQAPPAGRQSR